MRTARRILLLLAASFALLACNDKNEGPGDTAPERFSGTIVQKRELGTDKEFGMRKPSDVGPNCWQLVVEDTVGKKEQRVCVSPAEWERVFVGDPYFRTQKYMNR